MIIKKYFDIDYLHHNASLSVNKLNVELRIKINLKFCLDSEKWSRFSNELIREREKKKDLNYTRERTRKFSYLETAVPGN